LDDPNAYSSDIRAALLARGGYGVECGRIVDRRASRRVRLAARQTEAARLLFP
jgi:hypothetical protein